VSEEVKQVTVTKAQIIEAIQKETKLNPGTWIHPPYDKELVEAKPKECRVCAVGAVLQDVLLRMNPEIGAVNVAELAGFLTAPADITPTFPTKHQGDIYQEDLADLTKQALKLVEQRLYMNALSVYFEGVSFLDDWKYGGHLQRAEVRRKVVTFVEEHFPDAITIGVDEVYTRPAQEP
jgi:hypothetical protein